MKLNLGCGNDYRKGYLNVDNSPYVKKDKEIDLNKYPLPFKSDSVEYILCMAVMEHIYDTVKFMEEVHRILKPGAKLRFRVPMAFTWVDSKDPTHKTHFTPSTFDLWLKGYKGSKPTKIKFKGKVWITIPKLHNLRFPKHLYYLNSIINNIFTGVEGELIKI